MACFHPHFSMFLFFGGVQRVVSPNPKDSWCLWWFLWSLLLGGGTTQVRPSLKLTARPWKLMVGRWFSLKLTARPWKLMVGRWISLKLTARPWKLMVGRWISFWGNPIFRCYVCFREGNPLIGVLLGSIDPNLLETSVCGCCMITKRVCINIMSLYQHHKTSWFLVHLPEKGTYNIATLWNKDHAVFRNKNGKKTTAPPTKLPRCFLWAWKLVIPTKTHGCFVTICTKCR